MAMDRGKGHHMILSAAHLSNAVLTQRAISGPCETQRLESRGGCWDGPRCKDQDPELDSTWRTKTLTADAQYTGGPRLRRPRMISSLLTFSVCLAISRTAARCGIILSHLPIFRSKGPTGSANDGDRKPLALDD